ncbi:MAG: type II toxin-antitoxin system VapC family toxin [Microbacterium sp.]
MIVVDASAMVELIADVNGLSTHVRDVLFDDPHWSAPEHAKTEAANALRGLWLGRHSNHEEFVDRLAALARIELTSVPIDSALPRIAELAANATVYDAAYLALGERLDAPIVTCDGKLARVPGITAEVQVIRG